MKKILILLIRFYQKFISPMFPAKCRFYPTCSQYTLEAIKEYGAIKGTYLGIKSTSPSRNTKSSSDFGFANAFSSSIPTE